VHVVHINDIASVATTLVAAQERAGVHAVVLDPAKPFGSVPYPWKLLTLPMRAVPLVRAAHHVRAGTFDLVHVHYATHAAVGLFARRAYVVHCHGSDVRGVKPDSVVGRYLRHVLAPARAVVYSTPDLEPAVRPLYPAAQWLPNPIDTSAFEPGGIPERDVLLGVRLDHVKGAIVAVEAVARLLARRPATTVTVIAQGPLLPLAVARLGSRVVIEPPVPHDRMPGLLRRHRVALGQFRLGILSQYELEAMAAGVPLVADFRFGSAYSDPPPVVPASDALTAADQLERLLGDEATRRDAAARGRHWVVAEHAADRIAAQVAEIYRTTLAHRPNALGVDR